MEFGLAASKLEQSKGNCETVFSDERLMELRAHGLTIQAIAKALGVSCDAIYERVRAHFETVLH